MSRFRTRCLVFTPLLLLILAACGSESDSADAERYAHLLSFDTARVRLVTARDTTAVIVELAETPDQHTMGLMERRTLPANAGMLFLYSSVQPESSAYWMYRTRLPLDIAFIDSVGRIQTIQTMVPCPTTIAQGCPNYPAGARYIAALEVNAGYFSRNGVRVGDKLVLSDTAVRRPAGPRKH
jgi:uncharacterized membrane protein (UPF0127 family)